MLAHTDLSLLETLHHVVTEADHLLVIGAAALVGVAIGWARRRVSKDA